MDQRTQYLLREWGHEDLIAVFQAEQIDYEALLIVDNDFLKEYLPLAGPRLKFLQKIKSLPAEPTDSHSNSGVLSSLETPGTSVETPKSPTVSNSVSNDASSNDVSRGNTPSSQRPARSSFGRSRAVDVCVNSQIDKLDVREILKDGGLAQQVLHEYKTNNILDLSSRTIVTHAVSAALLKISKELKHPHMLIVANKLVEVFPTESPGIYFQSPNPLNDQVKATGKLYNRYHRLKAKLRHQSIGGIHDGQSCSHQPTDTVPTIRCILSSREVESKEDYLSWTEWMNNNTDQWDKCLKLWTKTAPKRLKELLQPETPVVTVRREKKRKTGGADPDTQDDEPEPQLLAKYYKDWPVLKHDSGYQLLVEDFAFLYPEHADKLFRNWKLFYSKVLVLADTEVRDEFGKLLLAFLKDKDISKNARNAMTCSILVSICQPTMRIPVRRNNKNTVWKVSICESRNAFILHVKTTSAGREALQERDNQLLSRGLRKQPLIVVVGEDLKNLTHHILVVDNITYKLPNLLVALDSCFKAFFALNAQYPRECEQAWLIIQRCVFGIKTQFDSAISNIDVCLKSLICP